MMVMNVGQEGNKGVQLTNDGNDEKNRRIEKVDGLYEHMLLQLWDKISIDTRASAA